jgi:hypothetical protein
MDKEKFHSVCGDVQGWFSANLGSKSVMNPSVCLKNCCGHQQHQGHNKQESTTFILPYGSNKQHCMDKEEFHWVCGVVQGWFSAKLGSKSVTDPSSCQHNFCGHQQHQGQGHNKQKSTTFILPYGSNKQHCMDKEESYWVYGVVQGWFSAKFGSKIGDGSQQLSAKFLWPPTSPGTSQTGINHFHSSIWIQQTALYGQGRVLLGLWCHIWLVYRKTWVKINDESKRLSAKFLWPPTATGT